MKNYWLLLCFPVLIMAGCKQKEKKESKNFISILSLIRKQVSHVDTSLYSIIKIVYRDSTHIDTTYIPREQFAEVAKEFLDIPDLSDEKVAARYKEETPIYDTLINRVIITYTPLEPSKEEVKTQQLLATPVPGEESKINNIIINTMISNRDSSLERKMLWQMDRSFQIITTTQKPGKPEITTFTKVTWNEEAYR